MSNAIAINKNRNSSWNNHIDVIEPIPGYNARSNRLKKESLKRQILLAGEVKEAIIGYRKGNRFLVKHGNGRTECVRELIALTAQVENGYQGNDDDRDLVELIQAGHRVNPMIKCNLMDEPKTDEQWANMYFSQITDNDGEEISIIDQAVIFENVAAKYGWTNQKIREMGGNKYSVAHIGQVRKLVHLPEDKQQMIRDGVLSGSEAIKLIQENLDRTNQDTDDVKVAAQKASIAIDAAKVVADKVGSDKIKPKHIKAAKVEHQEAVVEAKIIRQDAKLTLQQKYDRLLSLVHAAVTDDVEIVDEDAVNDLITLQHKKTAIDELFAFMADK